MMAESESNAKLTGDDAKPTFFHDFLGSHAAGDDPSPAISAASDLGSEKQVINPLEGFPFYGLGAGSDLTGSEMSNRSAGYKRSLSDSAFMGSSGDGFQHVRPESAEGLHLKKILRNADEELPRQANDEAMFFALNPLRPTLTLHLSGPPSGSRTDPSGPKWDQGIPLHVAPTLQHAPLHLGQISPFGIDTPPNKFKDGNAGPSRVSQFAADEGSRTGIKGSGILNSINVGIRGPNRVPSEVMLSGIRNIFGKPNSQPESSALASRHESASGSRQMTIFYGGQAHVFDDVPPNKADVIMALAGSNGGSWSTSYAKSATLVTGESFKPNDAGVASKHVTPGEFKRSLSIAGSHEGGAIMNVKHGESMGGTRAV